MDLDAEILLRFAVALGIGAMLGTEREVRKGEQTRGLSGLRTFTVIALLGGVCAFASVRFATPALFLAGLGCVLATELVRLVRAAPDPGEGLAVTGTYAALATFLLAGLAVHGQLLLAVALGVAAALVLALKAPLHSAIGKLAGDDVVAGLQLLAATFVILPLLPAAPVDPWGVLHLRSLWLLVILIATLSLLGYAASRSLGDERGAVVTGLFGGIVSSTAVTLAFARRSRDVPVQALALAAGILVAWGSMPVRMLIEVAVVNPRLVLPMLPPCVGMALPGAAFAIWLVRRGSGSRRAATRPPMKTPFSLPQAVQFALLFAVVQLAVEAAQRFDLPGGLLLVSALAGATDVDAITLTLAQRSLDGLSLEAATSAAVVAALTNTVIKAGFAVALGAPALRRAVAWAALAVIAGAGIGTWVGQLIA